MHPPSPRRLRERVREGAARALRRSGVQDQSSAAGTGASPVPPVSAPAARFPETSSETSPEPSRETSRETPLLERLLLGEDLTAVVLGKVRSWVADDRVELAVSLSESLRAHVGTREVGGLASGVLAFRRGLVELAWTRFLELPRATWATYAPQEYARCGLATDRARTVDELRDVAANDPSAISQGDWLTILGVVFGAGEHRLAGEILDVVETMATESPGRRPAALDRRRAWLAPWIRSEPGRTSPRRGRPVFAVMDYGHPGMYRRSVNIGDHIQSIASLGHLVRHRSVRFHGADDLVDLLRRLAERTRPELRCDDVEADLDVMTIHRDASMYQEVPEGTWTLCFGWFMHPLFNMRYGFPMHDALRPLFVSFHCNKRELLTDDAIGYLRRYGPVGCRDWTTVYLLLSAGVPAFFSGCLTTTVSTVFPEPAERPPPTAPVGYVDVPEDSVEPGAPTFGHSDRAVRRRSFLENCDDAVNRLETYRTELSAVVTSRLHAYLPLRSLGVPVDFRPPFLSDIRLDGLAGISESDFASMRDGLLDLLQRVFSLILAGADEEEVYERWRELTADRVAAAESRLRAPAPARPVPVLLAERVAATVAATVTIPATVPGTAETVHCAVFVTKSEVNHLAPLVRSIEAHTEHRLHVWVLGRGLAEKSRQALARSFPAVTFSWVRTGALDRTVQKPSRTPNAVSRLILPELLPDVQRVVVLPVSTVVEGDLAELAGMDLAGHSFAAARSRSLESSGFHLINQAATRLGGATDLSSELRRTAFSRHAFDFDAFCTDLLVVDLTEATRLQPSDEAVPLMAHYELRPDEVLHYLAGPQHAELPEAWQHVPGEDVLEHPELVLWRGTGKPWSRRFVPEQSRWRSYTQKPTSRYA